MRSHSALYVDAGYLLAAAASRLTGSSTPTPADLLHRVRTAVEPTSPSLMLSDPEEVRSIIQTAARRTFTAWAATATDDGLEELQSGRPSIPRDLDRALLVDVSEALKTNSLDDRARVQLRTEFWRTVDER